MAHELKTPLCVIRGFAENLKENTVAEKRDHYLDQIILDKKLLILFQPEETFCVNGDRQYLEKVMGNLLSNAVSYNIEGGTIQISINKDQCRIENTGGHISESDLPHIFEMFFGGQKRSADGEKHLGMGLYLSQKICAMHHLGLEVQNTEMGVAVIVSRSPVKRHFIKNK